jgi:hypothetical protein
MEAKSSLQRKREWNAKYGMRSMNRLNNTSSTNRALENSTYNGSDVTVIVLNATDLAKCM